MLVFSQAGCGMRDGTREKRPSKTAIKPHSARSLLSLLIRDVLFWYTVTICFFSKINTL